MIQLIQKEFNRRVFEESYDRIEKCLNEDKLRQEYVVQGFNESGMSIVIHVAEHFSYHVGQIVLYTKLLKDVDLGFYAGIDLNVKTEDGSGSSKTES